MSSCGIHERVWHKKGCVLATRCRPGIIIGRSSSQVILWLLQNKVGFELIKHSNPYSQSIFGSLIKIYADINVGNH